MEEHFPKLKAEFLEDVASVFTMEEIPAELVLNWDQTGIRIVCSSSRTMQECRAKGVESVVGGGGGCQTVAQCWEISYKYSWSVGESLLNVTQSSSFPMVGILPTLLIPGLQRTQCFSTVSMLFSPVLRE